jgi:hypothetical protein
LGGVLKGLALCGNPACTETCASAGGVGPFGSYPPSHTGGAFLRGGPPSHAGDPFGGGAFRGTSSSSRALELPAGLQSSGMALAVINLALGGGALVGIPTSASAETCACGGGALTGIVSSASAETCAGGDEGGALTGNVSSASAETCATCAARFPFAGSRHKALKRGHRSCVFHAPTGSAFFARISAAVAAAMAAASEQRLFSRSSCRSGEASLGGGALVLCTGALDEAAAWAETMCLLWRAWSICKSVMFEEDAAQEAAIG